MVNRNVKFGNEVCEQLEYELTEVFRSTQFLSVIPGWWCDGFEPQQCSLEELLKSRSVSTNCYIGKDGQSKFEALIYLGDYTLKNISRQNVVMVSAVELSTENPVELDQDGCKITIYLR